jgi:hypothetical protein
VASVQVDLRSRIGLGTGYLETILRRFFHLFQSIYFSLIKCSRKTGKSSRELNNPIIFLLCSLHFFRLFQARSLLMYNGLMVHHHFRSSLIQLHLSVSTSSSQLSEEASFSIHKSSLIKSLPLWSMIDDAHFIISAVPCSVFHVLSESRPDDSSSAIFFSVFQFQ